MLEDTAYVTGIIRDILLIFVLVFIGVALFVVFRKLSSILDSVDGDAEEYKRSGGRDIGAVLGVVILGRRRGIRDWEGSIFSTATISRGFVSSVQYKEDTYHG